MTNIDSQPTIVVRNMSKKFVIPHERIDTLKGKFVNIFRKKSYETFYALDDISFEVKKGEFFGIIGRNGSGKSTLLKILAGIYTPDQGSVVVKGMISPFLELGIGFTPELSGRDNIYLNATVLGLTKKQIDKKFDSIVAFSELERFIDQKLKNYSSGMQVRLAFSVAVHANRDILLLDEVLAVGDSNFQMKCHKEFARYKETGKTVILVSHDVAVVEQYCERAVLLRNGKIGKIGKATEVVSEYIYQNMSDEEKRILEPEKLKKNARKFNFIPNENLGEMNKITKITEVSVGIKKELVDLEREKNAQINALLESTSWKITKPLRVIADITKYLYSLVKNWSDTSDLNKFVCTQGKIEADFDFLKIWEKCHAYTMTSRERGYMLYKSVRYIVENEIPGDFVECGVWKGGSVMIMAETLLMLGENNKSIYLYDTFAGMSEPSDVDKDLAGALARDILEKDTTVRWNSHVWAISPLEEVKRNVTTTGYPKEKFIFVQGKVEDTLAEKKPGKISLLRLDTDWYVSTLHEMNYLYPLLEVGGVLIIDDYGYWEGTKKAIDEYFSRNRLSVDLKEIDYAGRLAIKSPNYLTNGVRE